MAYYTSIAFRIAKKRITHHLMLKFIACGCHQLWMGVVWREEGGEVLPLHDNEIQIACWLMRHINWNWSELEAYCISLMPWLEVKLLAQFWLPGNIDEVISINSYYNKYTTIHPHAHIHMRINTCSWHLISTLRELQVEFNEAQRQA